MIWGVFNMKYVVDFKIVLEAESEEMALYDLEFVEEEILNVMMLQDNIINYLVNVKALD